MLSHIHHIKDRMWEYFIKAKFVDMPWMICGDLNCIIDSKKKKGLKITPLSNLGILSLLMG